MLSEPTTAVVTPSFLMTTAADVASRDGVSRQAVTKKVREFAEKGMTVERDGRGAIVRFNVAEYDHLRGRLGNPSKDQRAQRPDDTPIKADPNESYDEALRQKTWHEAEKRRLELHELKSKLIRKDRLTDALVRSGEEIVRVIDGLPGRTDDLALAFEKDGAHGLRVALKKLAAQMRSDIASSLSRIADGADPYDLEDGEA